MGRQPAEKPRPSHPWRQEATIGRERAKERARIGEAEWRAECLARREERVRERTRELMGVYGQ